MTTLYAPSILLQNNHTLPDGFEMRPLRMDDLQAVTDMLNLVSRQVIGVEEFTLADMEREMTSPNFNLETDTRLVIAPDGQIAGYYEVWDLNAPHVRTYCWGHIHPDYDNLGLDQPLLAWAKERASQALLLAPSHARVVMVSHDYSRNLAAQRRYEAAGLALIRHSLRMVIPMNGHIPAPVWPEGITVRAAVLDDELRAVIHAVRDSFKDHWGFVEGPFEQELERWRHHIDNNEDFDPALWFVAMDGDEIAGISLCYPKTDDDPEMGWVGTLGVRRPWRRLGLGLALLHHSFAEFQRRGKLRVGLGVDAQNLTGALRLYYRAGMQPDPTYQFNTYEIELRPGEDLSTQTVEAV